MGDRIQIFDTTLRDGEQSPGCSMLPDEKLRLARQIERLGVDVIEAGFPAASKGDWESVHAIAAEIRGASIAALCRCREADIRSGATALAGAQRPRIHVFLATSSIHLRYKLRIDERQALKQAVEAVSFARSLCEDVEFSAEDASRSDPAYLEEVCAAVYEAGATTLNMPDTVGYAMPDEMRTLFTRLVKAVPGATFSTHNHNDLGLAVANSIAAVQAGARQVEATVNGIGERAGNTSLEEVVMAIRTRPDVYAGIDTAIVATEIYPSSRLLASTTGVAVQPNKAIVGQNAFASKLMLDRTGWPLSK
jgi:2-isopropylmalate synthase